MGEFEFDFAEWLGNEMEQTGMTIQELADKSGLVKQTIFYYLMGDRSPSLISFILKSFILVFILFLLSNC